MAFSVALGAVAVFALAIITVAILPFHAAITIFLSCKCDIRESITVNVFNALPYRNRACVRSAPNPFRTCSSDTSNKSL